MPSFKDLSGQRVGRLLVIRRNGTSKHGNATWLCKCDCGTECTTLSTNLARSHSRSCGCLALEVRTRHGRSRDGQYQQKLTYRSWYLIFKRCRNPLYKQYPEYGGRGIDVCQRWEAFENFLADMGERPGTEYSIERTDNDRGYEPGNCVWATRKVQQRNKRNTRWVEWNGVTACLAEHCENAGVDYGWAWWQIVKSRRPPSEVFGGK